MMFYRQSTLQGQRATAAAKEAVSACIVGSVSAGQIEDVNRCSHLSLRSIRLSSDFTKLRRKMHVVYKLGGNAIPS